jgi:hypothetical protein
MENVDEGKCNSFCDVSNLWWSNKIGLYFDTLFSNVQCLYMNSLFFPQNKAICRQYANEKNYLIEKDGITELA